MCYTSVMTSKEALQRLQALDAQLGAIDQRLTEAIPFAHECVTQAEIRAIEERIAKIA